MQVQEKVIETLKLLDEKSILKLYDLALAFKNKKESKIMKTNKLNLSSIKRSQKILSSIKDSLSDDIQIEREERC